MLWLLVVIFFGQGAGQVAANAEPFPSQKACAEAAYTIQQKLQAEKPAGIAAVVLKCTGPISNPVTERSAEATP